MSWSERCGEIIKNVSTPSYWVTEDKMCPLVISALETSFEDFEQVNWGYKYKF